MNDQEFADFLNQFKSNIESHSSLVVEGRLTRMVGMTLEAVGCSVNVGERCFVETVDGKMEEAEVVGFAMDKIYLMPIGSIQGLGPGARVIPTHRQASIPVGEALLGRVLDGQGNPIDGKGSVHCHESRPLASEPINPLNRKPVEEPLDVGVRSINSVLTVGRGQRMGLLAGSGVGKSVLLGMMTRFTEAEVIVVGLIGERGREVKEFIQQILGDEGVRRSVVVAVPADNSPLMRLQGAMSATTIAEYFRDQGKNVLLLMDSLTRFCQAQREVALAIGEPPATKGYPPSVFALLPKLVERAGNGSEGSGSITAFYTVLAEGDDQQDPIVDAARAILDGHIVLTRELADSGHYPAIDIEGSVSRVINQITSEEHRDAISQLKFLYSTYNQNKDLITVGAYQKGSDSLIDQAIEMMPAIRAFLCQNINEKVVMQESIDNLQQMMY
ncbi:flagellar protein export ATPase FliI [Aliikangiella marina]|uniref:Flagellum-specific ATP synthase n=1 Tax=Aliikangiella marina TaxID=1712262 RepID=A0A545TEK3_9GAMM|nr:flagellar protein export ATPase FliI [Aliikangiella marina]TQV75640.1 flagellar protein export ATPase FliI [Aliikangiella marina]